ncbi:MAG: hypothetical protein IJO57_01245 [Bacilli bacterium]|nr:hypothetical protein [Bacilli bacterium]
MAETNAKNQKAIDQSKKFAEDWLPVENIQNGAIILANKWKVTGVKITPRNIFILDQESQANTLIALKNLYNMLDYEFWIIAADRPVDITLYLSQLQLLYNNTPNPKVRKLITEDIDKANLFINNNVVDTEYYLIFQEKKDDIMQKRVRDLISGFTACGLIAMQTTNEDLRVLLDNFFNNSQSTTFGTVLPS